MKGYCKEVGLEGGIRFKGTPVCPNLQKHFLNNIFRFCFGFKIGIGKPVQFLAITFKKRFKSSLRTSFKGGCQFSFRLKILFFQNCPGSIVGIKLAKNSVN